jgi:hypothetical protein
VLQRAHHIGGLELRTLGQVAGRKLLVGRRVGDHQKLLHLGGEKEICGTHFSRFSDKWLALSRTLAQGECASGLYPASFYPRRFRRIPSRRMAQAYKQ